MTPTGVDPREHLAMVLRLQAAGCRHMGSAFYGDLLELMAHDAEHGNAVLDMMGEHATDPFEAVYHLRLLGGLHRMALTGESPDLHPYRPTRFAEGDLTQGLYAGVVG